MQAAVTTREAVQEIQVVLEAVVVSALVQIFQRVVMEPLDKVAMVARVYRKKLIFAVVVAAAQVQLVQMHHARSAAQVV